VNHRALYTCINSGRHLGMKLDVTMRQGWGVATTFLNLLVRMIVQLGPDDKECI